MMFPTKLGFAFAGLGFLLYVVSLQSQSGLLFLILGILAGAYILNFFESRRSVKFLQLTPPALLTGVEGEIVKGTWEVSNQSKYSLGLARIRGPWGTLFRLGALKPQETIHVTPSLRLQRRGVYPFAELRLDSSYPFGLFAARRRAGIKGEFVVYPKTYQCPVPLADGFEPMVGGKYTGRHKSASGDHFHGVRPLRPPDPVKMIHWPSSAKGQGLMVKEFEQELSGRVAVILDTQLATGPQGELLLDWAARAVASLVLAALDYGHQVEYMNLSDYQHFAVPPFAAGDPVMENLARLEPSETELQCSQLEKAIFAMPRKAAICLVLQSLPANVAAYLQSLGAAGRKISVYLPSAVSAAAAAGLSVRCYDSSSLAVERNTQQN